MPIIPQHHLSPKVSARILPDLFLYYLLIAKFVTSTVRGPLFSPLESGLHSKGASAEISADIKLYIERLYVMSLSSNFSVHGHRYNSTFTISFDEQHVEDPDDLNNGNYNFDFPLSREGTRNVWMCLRLCQIGNGNFRAYLMTNKGADYKDQLSPSAYDWYE